MIVEVKFENRKILIIIYTPNSNQEAFLTKQYQKVMTLEHQDFYLIGEFNVGTDKQLDRSMINRKSKKGLLPKIFIEMAEEVRLIDCWGTQNPQKKQFTFFSNRYNSWSRIDICWSTIQRMDLNFEAEILSMTFADCPVWA